MAPRHRAVLPIAHYREHALLAFGIPVPCDVLTIPRRSIGRLLRFDRAMDDTVLALNTGYWPLRNGKVIERGEGKSHLENPRWRSAMDDVARVISSVWAQLRSALALNEMFERRFHRQAYDDFDYVFRSDWLRGRRIGDLPYAALQTMNSVLSEAGLNPLPSLGN